PLSQDIPGHVAEVLISLGRYDEAAELSLKRDLTRGFLSQRLARSRLGQGRVDEAIRIMADLPDLPRNPQSRGFLGFDYARAGRRKEAERMAAASLYANEQALIYAGLGDKDRTLAALNRMAELGAQRVGVYINYPEMAFLRDDSRLKALRKT